MSHPQLHQANGAPIAQVVHLPLAPAMPPSILAPALPRDLGGDLSHDRPLGTASQDARQTVLLVEDQPDVRDTLAAILMEFGFLVSTADTGRQALAQIENGLTFDVMIADFAMPGMNGLELAAAVRTRWPNLPVILITGYQDEPRMQRERWVLSKPFGAAALLETLSEALSESAVIRCAV
jgi:CheY-like chemotaxis protein